MVMLNSNILYSDVVKVSNPYAEPAISISPNPVNEKTVYMQFINSMGNFSAVVLDMEGKKISTSTLTIKNIRENKMIALPASCAKGIYKLVLTNEKGKNQTITFMVL